MNILITSEINKNYYIINNGAYSIAVLISLIKNKDEELSNILLEASMIIEGESKFIFVKKSSTLGIILEELINNGQLIDGNKIITEKHLVNAYTNAIMKSEVSVPYLNTMENMLRNQSIGLISELKDKYPEEILKLINKVGRKSWFSSDKNKRKYLKEISLTGYENLGLLYINNQWTYIEMKEKGALVQMEQLPLPKIRINEKKH